MCVWAKGKGKYWGTRTRVGQTIPIRVPIAGGRADKWISKGERKYYCKRTPPQPLSIAYFTALNTPLWIWQRDRRLFIYLQLLSCPTVLPLRQHSRPAHLAKHSGRFLIPLSLRTPHRLLTFFHAVTFRCFLSPTPSDRHARRSIRQTRVNEKGVLKNRSQPERILSRSRRVDSIVSFTPFIFFLAKSSCSTSIRVYTRALLVRVCVSAPSFLPSPLLAASSRRSAF